MSFLEIIIIGMVTNIIGFAFIIVFTFMFVLLSNKFNPEFMKELIYLEKLIRKHKDLKYECDRLNILSHTQKNYLILIPFSGILISFIVFFYAINGSLNRFYINEIEKVIDILETRIKKAEDEKL
jgi:hypothetical protein